MTQWSEKGHLQREALLYNKLAERGIKTTFITYGSHEDYKWKNYFHQDIKIIPVYTKLKYSKYNILNILKSLLIPFLLKSEIHKSTILKTNQLWGGWVPLLIKWFYKKPLIVRCGYEYLKFLVFQNKPAIKIKFVKLLSGLIYKNANKIIVASPDDKDFIEKTFRGVSAEIIVKTNWIDTNIFRIKKVKNIKNKILFVGRLNQQKNIPFLFNALKGLDISLDIIGDGDQKNHLLALAKDKNINVNFLGTVPNSEMPKIYSKYPIYVLCSKYEGNPKTLLEAMACGLLVIGTDVPGINSIIINNVNGFLVKDYNELRDTVKNLALDNFTNEIVSRNAREYIVKNCSLNNYVTSEIKTYIEFTG